MRLRKRASGHSACDSDNSTGLHVGRETSYIGGLYDTDVHNLTRMAKIYFIIKAENIKSGIKIGGNWLNVLGI